MNRDGLYDPQTEKDSCGIGFVANIKGEKSRAIVERALEVLQRMAHRAATGADPLTGDGAGIMVQIPHRFFKREGLKLGFEISPLMHSPAPSASGCSPRWCTWKIRSCSAGATYRWIPRSWGPWREACSR